MAYNPFNFFRRNSKIFFAVLTVVVMVMFVLSFGQGDFFSTFPKKVSEWMPYGEDMAKIDGNTIKQSQLDKISEKRVLANTFMEKAVRKAYANSTKQFDDLSPKLTNGKKLAEEFKSARQIHQMTRMPDSLRYLMLGFQDFEVMQRLQSGQISPMEVQGRIEQNTRYLTSGFAALSGNEAASSEDRDAARAALNIIHLESIGRQYFRNQPNETLRDRLEFLLWLKKAEKLGIQYVQDDVAEMVEFDLKQFSKADRESVYTDMVASQSTKLTQADLYDALADEFKVRAAQSAVLGLSHLQPLAPASVPPAYDYYEFFKDHTSEATYSVIAVPYDLFLTKVTGTPTESEINAIYQKALNTEPSPDSPRPGIKEPRRVKVAYAEVTGKEAYYESAAKEAVNSLDLQAKLSQLFVAPFGPGTASLLVAPAILQEKNPILAKAYEDYARGQQTRTVARWSNPAYDRFGVVDSSLANPQYAASLVGLITGSYATGNPFLADIRHVVRKADQAEQQARLAAGLRSFVTPTLPGSPLLTELVGGQLSTAAAVPTLPEEKARTVVAAQVKADLLYNLLAPNDLIELRKQLAEKLKNTDSKKGEEEAKALLEKFVKDRGFTKVGGSTELRDVHTIADDPGLQTLRGEDGSLMDAFAKVKFGRSFFFDTVMDPQSRRESQQLSEGVYKLSFYPPRTGLSENQPLFLVWRTEDVKAEAPKKLDEKTKAKCVTIWRQQKAKALAKAAMDEWAAETAKWGDSPVVIGQKYADAEKAFLAKHFPTDPLAATRLKKFTQSKVAETVVSAGFTANQYSANPYTLRPDMSIPFPNQKMLNDLVGHRNDPLSTSFVMVDQPETTYYLTVMSDKTPKSPDQFRESVYRPTEPNAEAQGMLSMQFGADARRKALTEALNLLKAEFRYENENPKAGDKLDKSAG